MELGVNTNCCATSVPHHGSLKVLAKAVGAWQERLQAGLSRSIEASDNAFRKFILWRTFALYLFR